MPYNLFLYSTLNHECEIEHDQYVHMKIFQVATNIFVAQSPTFVLGLRG